MTIKEKAKAYDEAIEIARDYHKRLLDDDNPEWASEIEKIFSELKESEGERIRKALITYFQRFPYDSLKDAGINAKDAIAWLESKSAPEAINEPVDNADKVESKFKIGDWVMNKSGGAFSNGSISARVQRIEGHKVWLEHGTWADESELKQITD